MSRDGIKSFFQGCNTVFFTCQHCDYVQIIADEFFSHLKLPLLTQKGCLRTVREAINSFFQPTIFTDLSPWCCPSCHDFSAPLKTNHLTSPPQVLLLMLERWSTDKSVIPHVVTLDDSVVLATTFRHVTYTLRSAIFHKGDNIDTGHYFNYIKYDGKRDMSWKNSDVDNAKDIIYKDAGQYFTYNRLEAKITHKCRDWYYYDDDIRQPCDTDNPFQNEVNKSYILFYERENDPIPIEPLPPHVQTISGPPILIASTLHCSRQHELLDFPMPDLITSYNIPHDEGDDGREAFMCNCCGQPSPLEGLRAQKKGWICLIDTFIYCVVCIQACLETSDPRELNDYTELKKDLTSVPSAVAFSGYFERQVDAHCGLHALNNAIGGPMFNVHDMKSGCTEYLAQIRREGFTERRDDHLEETGWYSAEIMAFVLEAKFTDHRLDHCNRIHFDATNPVQIETAGRIYDPQVCGIVVNKDEAH